MLTPLEAQTSTAIRIVADRVDIGAYEFQFTTRYVDANNTNAMPPYLAFATAATNLQDAVDAAVAGDEIVVTNGTYSGGGHSVNGEMNRVVLDKALLLRSINGPQFTIIDGGDLCRCLYLKDGASVTGFTLTHGAAIFEGAGVWCASQTAIVSNCVLATNRALYYGEFYPAFVLCYRFRGSRLQRSQSTKCINLSFPSRRSS